MDQITLVEKLRQSVDLSYEEAKAVLEAADWDLLEAMIQLEKQGKTEKTAYTTKKESKTETLPQYNPEEEKSSWSKFLAWCGKIIHKGNTNYFRILQQGEKKADLPVSALVLLLIFLPWASIPLLIIGMFFGFHYRFVGSDLGKDSINAGLEKAAKAAEAVKEEFQSDKEKE